MKNVSITQVVSAKASASSQKLVGLMQTLVHRTCISACQLFCLPLERLPLQRLPCGNISCCSGSAQAHQLRPGEQKQDHSQAVQTLPPTILIVNISNSTLIDCIIGDSCPSAVADRRPLMQEHELQKHAQLKCGCSHKEKVAAQSLLPPPPLPPSPACPASPPQEQLNISIESSHLNCVIIGDNNYMHTEMNPRRLCPRHTFSL